MKNKETAINIDTIDQEVGNRFLLCAAIAKRARQLKEGAKPLVERASSSTYILTAMEELEKKKLKIQAGKEAEQDKNNDLLLEEIKDFLDTPISNNKEAETEESAPTTKKDAQKSI